MTFKQKYLKYKSKYLNLKGGGVTDKLKSIFKNFAQNINLTLTQKLDNLTTTEKIVLASRLFTFNFDRLINNRMRKILNEDEQDIYIKDMLDCIKDYYNNFKSPWSLFYSEKWISNELRTKCNFVPILLKYLNISTKEDILILTDFIYLTILNNSVELKEEFVVYRGINVFKDNIYDYTNLNGFTSTSYNKYSASYFIINSLIDKKKTYDDLDENKPNILKIILPKGTLVFTPDICTIQQEEEIIVVSQGKLELIKKYEKEYTSFTPLYRQDYSLIGETTEIFNKHQNKNISQYKFKLKEFEYKLNLI
jgi:hypothetical protein